MLLKKKENNRKRGRIDTGQMIKWITLWILMIAAIFDRKWRQIPGWLVMVTGIGGIFYAIAVKWSKIDWIVWMIGSMAFLSFCKMTKQAIGYGDAMMWSVTELYLGIRENGKLWITAFLLIFLFSIAGLLLKKINSKTLLPFLPFLAAAHGVLMATGR